MPFNEESILKEALHNIYNNIVDVKGQIEPNLYKGTSQTYRQAVDEGFGTVKWGEPDYDFLQALKHNTDVLAAFKTHRQQNDIAALMLDDKGKLKPFRKFEQDVEGLIGKYNHNWITTEYNTAVIRARNAAKWKDFERDADIYPNLKWLETTSPDPDMTVHYHYWNRIWALTDPFWRRHYPGDRWSCKCGLTNTDDPVTDNSGIDHEPEDTKPTPGIDTNSGLSGEIFTDTHPYVKEAYRGAEEAVKNEQEVLASKISREEVRKASKGKSTIIIPSDGPKIPIHFAYQDVKTITGKPHKYNVQKNECCYHINEIMRQAAYMGWSDDIKGSSYKGHADAVKWHYYQFMLNKELSYITVKENAKGEFRIHSIQDDEHFDGSKIKERS